jgi:Leucine-rich repeat (LRR) protein
LNLAGSLVSDLAPVKVLNNLRSLDIERTGIQNLGFISPLKNIISLKAADTPITDLKGLTGLSDLQMLDVRRTNPDHSRGRMAGPGGG